MKNDKEEEDDQARLTRVNKANAEGSFKTTIPIEVVEDLGLKYGDILAWYVDTDKDGDKFARFKKIRLEKMKK